MHADCGLSGTPYRQQPLGQFAGPCHRVRPPDPRWEATVRATHAGTAGPRARARGRRKDHHRHQRLSIADRYHLAPLTLTRNAHSLDSCSPGTLPHLAQHGTTHPNGRGPRKLTSYLGTTGFLTLTSKTLQLPPRILNRASICQYFYPCHTILVWHPYPHPWLPLRL